MTGSAVETNVEIAAKTSSAFAGTPVQQKICAITKPLPSSSVQKKTSHIVKSNGVKLSSASHATKEKPSKKNSSNNKPKNPSGSSKNGAAKQVFLDSDLDDECDTDVLSGENIKKLMIPIDEFMIALQDQGKMDKSGGQPKMKYQKLSRLCTKYWKKWKPVLRAKDNQTRATRGILNCILTNRHSVDVSALTPSLIKFATQDAETLLVVTNEDGGGQATAIRHCVSRLGSKISKTKAKRNPSLAVRLCAALCAPQL